jgi:hypothetical protein
MMNSDIFYLDYPFSIRDYSLMSRKRVAALVQAGVMGWILLLGIVHEPQNHAGSRGCAACCQTAQTSDETPADSPHSDDDPETCLICKLIRGQVLWMAVTLLPVRSMRCRNPKQVLRPVSPTRRFSKGLPPLRGPPA